MTLALILNIVFAAFVLTVIVGGFAWSIASQARAHTAAAVATVRRHDRARTVQRGGVHIREQAAPAS